MTKDTNMDDTSTVGALYLSERSGLCLQLAQSLAAKQRCIVIIDDNAVSANAIASNCRMLTDYTGHIVVQKALGDTRRDWPVTPDIIFINDHISRMGTSTLLLERLRAVHLANRVVMVSPALCLARRRRLIELGAFDALHFDDLGSFGIASVLLRCFSAQLKQTLLNADGASCERLTA
jgi:hypothetical protein